MTKRLARLIVVFLNVDELDAFLRSIGFVQLNVAVVCVVADVLAYDDASQLLSVVKHDGVGVGASFPNVDVHRLGYLT